MISSIKHRGPDGDGSLSWTVQTWTRLAAIDLGEQSNQPFVDKKVGTSSPSMARSTITLN